MTSGSVENQEVVLSERGTYVVVSGLSREEEDNLYSHLERVYGEDNVSGTINSSYLVRVEGISVPALLQQVAIYCVQNGKRVNV